MTRCGCTPGTPEDGWQEVRSAECLRREMDAWSKMLDKARERLQVATDKEKRWNAK